MRRSFTAWPALRSAASSCGLLYCRACRHCGWLAPTLSNPPCRESGRQCGASWGPARRGQSCQIAARDPSLRQVVRRASRQVLSGSAGAGGGGCSSSPLPKARRWDFGARAMAAVLERILES